MGLAIEYKDMCTVKPLKQNKSNVIEDDKQEALDNALKYLDLNIEWCVSSLSEKYMNMKKQMDDKEFIEEIKQAQVWLNQLNLCLNVEEKLKGRA